MRGRLTRLLMAAVALGAAAAFFVVFTAPPPALRLAGAVPPTVVLGAYHVHSSRSDGAATVQEIAGAAADAGLSFVIFTDHGDARRPPSPPSYIGRVLCIDAVEINTFNGHLVALNLVGPSPYPLAGEARDVIEDVHRQGGVAIAAHPDSPAVDLRWRGAARYDGLEWINADAEWRDDSAWRLAAGFARSLVRAPESIASLFSRPEFTLQRWDGALRSRPVIGLAALDAHASLGFEAEDGRRRSVVSWPSYRSMFKTIAQAVMLDQPPDGDAAHDAAALMAAMTRGRMFSVVTALAGPATLDFFAGQDGERAGIGDRLEHADAAQPTHIVAAVPQAPGVRLRLIGSGQIVSEATGRIDITRPLVSGAYRVEAYLPGASLPWIVSNPIYLGEVPPGDGDDPPAEPASRIPVPAESDWQVEKSDTSRGEIAHQGGALVFTYGLGAGPPAGQYAALVTRAAGEAGIDRIEMTASASRPMRVSLQIRLPGGSDAQRWRRSVFLDETPRRVVVTLADMERVSRTSSSLRPIVARVHSVLLVVDTLNTAPGSTGTISLRDVTLGVGQVSEGAEGTGRSVRSGQ